MRTIERAACILSQAAQNLIQQHKYSNGYTSIGESDIAEANMVIHAAASFIALGCHTWAESPFKDHETNRCKHLDLLVDLNSDDPEYSRLLTIEAKRITAGENDTKIDEILNDYERIKSWRSLDPDHFPLFYSMFHLPDWFYGGLLVVVPESCSPTGVIADSSISSWWRALGGVPTGYTQSGIEKLGRILESAAARDVIEADHWDGFDQEIGRRLVIMYALFDFGPTEVEGNIEAAQHEAAHALVAWRLGIPVRRMFISDDEELSGGAICDWESLYGSVPSRELCTRAFAIAYAGAFQKLRRTQDSDFLEVFNTLPTDHDAVVYTRKRLVEWERLSSINDTEQESLNGYQLADRIVQEEMSRIERLGKYLLEKRELLEPAIREWFAKDESEQNDVDSGV